MLKVLAVFSGVVSGICLFVIAVRKKLPTFLTLSSSKLKQDIDATDKYLCVVSLIFFLLCIVFTVIYLG